MTGEFSERKAAGGEPGTEACLLKRHWKSIFSEGPCNNRGSTPEQRSAWREGVEDQIREWMPMQGSLSIERMCHMGTVSRAGFYRSLKEKTPIDENMEVRSAV